MYSRKTSWILGTFGLAVALLAGCEKKQEENMTQQETVAAVEEQQQETPTVENSYVKIKTTQGDIVVELNGQKAPVTVKNFEEYVNAKFYDGTLFHRVIPGFMIQGGGFDKDFKQKETRAPIKNEADNGLKNTRGSIAMARTNDPNSASAQFFINLADNSFLDYRSPTPQGWGYAVFGNVVEGMDVVDKIAKVKTGSRAGHEDVPVENVMIESIEVVPAPHNEPVAAGSEIK